MSTRLHPEGDGFIRFGVEGLTAGGQNSTLRALHGASVGCVGRGRLGPYDPGGFPNRQTPPVAAGGVIRVRPRFYIVQRLDNCVIVQLTPVESWICNDPHGRFRRVLYSPVFRCTPE